MGEIIDHCNLPLFAPNFLPPLYPFEGFQGTGDDLQWDFQLVRDGNNRQRIEQIMPADQSGLKTTIRLSESQHLKSAPGRIYLNVTQTPFRLHIAAVKFDPAICAGNNPADIFICIEGKQQA